MYLRAREREIIELMLQEDRHISTKEIAERLNVSSRTVHRELKNIKKVIKKYGLYIDSLQGKGIRLFGPSLRKQNLLKDIRSGEHTDFSQEERKVLILCSLLEASEPLKLFTLAEKLNVTSATVSNDLDQIEEWIAQFDLKLIRKRGYGIELIGPENGKRALLGNIIMEKLDEKSFLQAIERQIKEEKNEKREKIFEIIDEEKIKTVEGVLENFRQTILFSIADSAYIALAVHLMLAAERIQKGETIDIDPQVFQELKGTKEFESARMIVKELEKAFQVKFPEAEIGYVATHLLGARRKEDKDFSFFDVDVDISRKVHALIEFVSNKTGFPLTEDQSLYQGLVAHFVPAITRSKEKIHTHNPLLQQIKTKFSTLFASVEEGVKKIFYDLQLSEDEIGFLVLHFGSALESKMENISLQGLVVCPSGIGSSKMLATRLRKEFPEIENIHIASLIDLKRLDVSQYDIIISTTDLPYRHVPYITVNPLLNEHDIAKIKRYMNEKLTEFKRSENNVPGIPFRKNPSNDMIHIIDQFFELGDIIKTVLLHFNVSLLENTGQHKKNLLEIARTLHKEKLITNDESVAKKLLAREQKGGLGIPGTKIALFHLKDEEVLIPLFRIYDLDKADNVLGMDGNAMEISRILLLLAPEQLTQNKLEILSQISSYIIESNSSLTLFESGDEAAVYHKLNEIFHRYMKEKFFNWSD
ncbi:BglG family transcription antiterminator [Aeribacillus sp. SP014]